MSTPSPNAAGASAAYSYRPSLLGAPWEFKLNGDGIAWVAGKKTGEVPFRAIRRVRISYRPANMQTHRFVTEVWADGAPRLRIVSTSWKNMMQQERLDKSYSAFVAELHRRIAQSVAEPIFAQGLNPLQYWAGVVVFAGVELGLAALAVRALQADAKAAAAFIAAFAALFLWQGGDFIRRNRPGVYRPDALPALLMPKG